MTPIVRINFDNLYALDSVSEDSKNISFTTKLKNGQLLPLHVKISDESEELFANVYNLAFGPLNSRGKIDDKIELAYDSYSRVFSTILFSAIRYLKKNPSHYIGVDGSDNLRAFFYYYVLQLNYDYLQEHFETFGLKYYVRINRFGKTQYDNPFNFEDILTQSEKIEKGIKIPHDEMYNYFTFRLNPKKYL